MPIDGSIPAGVTVPQLVNPMTVFAQAQQMRATGLENQQRQMALDEARKKQQEDDDYKHAIASSAGLTPEAFLEHVRVSAPGSFIAVQKAIDEAKSKAASTSEAMAKAKEAQSQANLHQQNYIGHLADQVDQADYNPVVFNAALNTAVQAFPEWKDQADQLRQIAATQGKDALRAALKPLTTAEVAHARLEAQSVAAKIPGEVADSAIKMQVAAGMQNGLTPEQQAQQHAPAYKEWKDYQAQGGKLDFNAYMDMDANRKKPVTNISGMAGMYNQTDPKAIAEGIKGGTMPPDITQYGRAVQGAVATELQKQGFNLAAAVTDWKATQKHVATMNNAQQLRLNQSINALPDLLDSVDGLAAQWKGGGFPILNKANLALAKGGAYGKPAASLANQLDSQISDVVADLGNVYMGGNSPTDMALGLAGKSLKADWDEKVLHDMVGLAKKNVGIRRNSINSTGVAGASAGNPYAPQQAQPTPPAPAATAPAVEEWVRDPKTGKLVKKGGGA